MKKNLLLVLFALFMSTSVMAWSLIPLSVNYDEEQPLTNGHPKTPITAPRVYIDDYTLLFETNHPEYILNIKDENNNVVYSTVVPSTQTQVSLPSTLSGNYEIHLVMGNWLFMGWINL